MGVYTLGCFCTIVLQCTDLRILWDSTVKATCWTGRTLKRLSAVNATVNIITDLAFSFFIPVSISRSGALRTLIVT